MTYRFLVLSVLAVLSTQALAGGEYLLESACAQASWAGGYGSKSLADAEKMIPFQVMKAAFAEKNIAALIPADVRKDPAKNGPAYYRDWAGSIFINPLDVRAVTKSKERDVFYFVSSDGNLVRGKLPNGFPEDATWDVQNQIRFENAVSGRETFLNASHSQDSKREEDGVTVTTFEEQVLTGEMEAHKGKYTDVEVEAGLGGDHRELVHFTLGGSIETVWRKLTDKEISPEAAQFVLDTCTAVKDQSEVLKFNLERLQKEIAKAKPANKGGPAKNHIKK